MQSPRHLFQLKPALTSRDSETVQVVSRSEAKRSTAVFHALALPTPRQFFSEVPFSVNFGPPLRERP